MKFCVWSLSRDLKIIEYVEYLSCISSEYFTSIAGAFVFPWTNKGSLVLYIACMRVVWPVWNLEAALYCQVHICDWCLWLWRPRVSLRFHLCASVLTVYPQYWQFFTMTTASTQLLGIWYSTRDTTAYCAIFACAHSGSYYWCGMRTLQ